MSTIATLAELEALYGRPGETSLVKEVDHVAAPYKAFIAAAPFAALATCGPEGLDCSPRGDVPGFVRVRDDKTLLLPDRRGNNRVDSLRNIIRDPRVSLMFLVPGCGNAVRVNGRAHLTVDPDVLASFAVEGKAPRSVIVIAVEAVYFQCARAIVRAHLWDAAHHVDPKSLPSAGEMLAAPGMTRNGRDVRSGRCGRFDADRMSRCRELKLRLSIFCRCTHAFYKLEPAALRSRKKMEIRRNDPEFQIASGSANFRWSEPRQRVPA